MYHLINSPLRVDLVPHYLAHEFPGKHIALRAFRPYTRYDDIDQHYSNAQDRVDD